MPESSLGIPYPASTGHTRLWEHIENLVSAVDAILALPDDVTAYGSGANVFTGAANTWAVLPTFTEDAVFTNPHADLDLAVDVTYGAWMATTTGNVRFGIQASGAITIATPGPGNGGARGWGEIPMTSHTLSGQRFGAFSCVIPAGGTVTFTPRGYRSVASGTQDIDYPTIRVKPRHYVAP